MLRRALRRAPKVLVLLCVVAGVAFAIDQVVLQDDETVASNPLRVAVLAPGSYESAHPFAPYYVVPRKRFRDPSRLSRVARNKITTQPESALAKGALAGSPQIVRLSLKSSADEPVIVEGVRFRVVSDARPLRGWFTAVSGCTAKPVRRAQAVLDSKRAVRYVSRNGVVSRNLSLEVQRSSPQILELRATAQRRRFAWIAELTVRGPGDARSTVTVDDGGEPFRVTSARASRGYEPVYGATGITSFAPSRSPARGGSDC